VTAVHQGGIGTFTLSGNNTYTGATAVSAGALRNGASEVLPDASDLTVYSGATYDLNGFLETIGSLSDAGDVLLGNGTSPLATVQRTRPSTVLSAAPAGSRRSAALF